MGNKLSVIVQASPQPLELSRCLTALASQQLPGADLEIVVVDPRSRRNIQQLVRWWNVSLARQGRTTRLLHVPLRDQVDADHAGLRISTGALVAFVDEEMIPDPEWAARSIDALKLREGSALELPMVRGVVHRRSYLAAMLPSTRRASVAAAGAGATESRPPLASPEPPHRLLVAHFDRLKPRFASVESYAAMAALFIAAGLVLLARYEAAATAALVCAIYTFAFLRRRSRSGGVVRPFLPHVRPHHLRSDG
jgi:hypothetical protein